MSKNIQARINAWIAEDASLPETKSYSFVTSGVDGAGHIFRHITNDDEEFLAPYLNHEFLAKFGRKNLPSEGLHRFHSCGFDNLSQKVLAGTDGISLEQLRLYFSLVYHITPPGLEYQQGATFRDVISTMFDKLGYGPVMSEDEVLSMRNAIDLMARRGLEMKAAREQTRNHA